MRYLAAYILVMLLAFCGGLFLDWWSIAIAAFVVAVFIPQRPFLAWLVAFLSVATLWGILAWFIDERNAQVMSARIASILPLGGVSLYLVLVTAAVGGLVSGMAALSGSLLRSLFRVRKPVRREVVVLNQQEPAHSLA